MMPKRELRKKFLAAVAPVLLAEQFPLVKSVEGGVRTCGSVRHILKIDFYSQGPGYRVVPAIQVGFDELAAIYHQVSGLSKVDQKFHVPISFAIWRMENERTKYEYPLASELDLEGAVAGVVGCLKDKALPFFASCRVVADVDRLLNGALTFRDALFYNAESWVRSAYGIIAARFVRNPRYDVLVDTYRTFLRGYQGGAHAEQYERLVTLLETTA